MTPPKRMMDLLLALVLLPVLLPVMLGVALMIAISDGRPVLYRSERMQSPQRGFTLYKFRTMRSSATDSGVTGADKSNRISRLGAFLRRTRLDELPQLWNILKGDISFVGPRPPLRHYVELYPDLYAQVLRNRPGVTGLATLAYHRTEAQILSQTTTAAQTEAVYCRRCIPRKARLDLIYGRQRTLAFDAKLMLATLWRGVSLHSRR
jgi:lipopolysaccharide/colanic/teichoic acid biosynthesis glycosyltransferase